MAGIIYSKSAGFNDAKLGKLTTPLRAVIEHESDLCKKDDKILDALYNVQKSNKFGETVQYQDEFGEFTAKAEGGRPENDSIYETVRKFIEHVTFAKEFTITREMLDDANYGITSGMARKAQAFTRAYYKTRNSLAVKALANGNSNSIVFNGAIIDLKCADGYSLFNKDHTYGSENAHASGTQSNNFKTSARASGKDIEVGDVLDILTAGNDKIRQMKDENGDAMGYTADTVIIPGNAPVLERCVKQAIGSAYEPSSSNNAINTQAGNWNLIVLPTWQPDLTNKNYPILVMSSEANRNLWGSMFFNRVALDIKDYVDDATRNWNWNGYCRFGVGFPTYKHIVRIVSLANGQTDANATAL